MYLKIRQASAISLNVAKGSGQMEINIGGLKPIEVLSQIDLTTVIEYYGITELLDIIGEDELRAHLNLLKYDQSHIEENETNI